MELDAYYTRMVKEIRERNKEVDGTGGSVSILLAIIDHLQDETEYTQLGEVDWSKIGDDEMVQVQRTIVHTGSKGPTHASLDVRWTKKPQSLSNGGSVMETNAVLVKHWRP